MRDFSLEFIFRGVCTGKSIVSASPLIKPVFDPYGVAD